MSSRAKKFKGATAQIRRADIQNRFRNSNASGASADPAAAGTYKTELCNKFMESGRCPYGTRCQFAHGELELRRSKRSTDRRFKTLKCRNFHNHGTCRYGKRCQFIHDETDEELAVLRGEEPNQRAPHRSPHLSPQQRSPSLSPNKSAETSPALECGIKALSLEEKLLLKLGPALVRHDSFRKLLSDVISEGEKKSAPIEEDNASVSSAATRQAPNSATRMASVRPKRLNVFRRMCSDSITDPLNEIQNSQFAEPLSPYQREVAKSITDERHGAMSPHISSRA